VAEVADDFYKRRIEPHRKRPKSALDILEKDIKRRLGAIPFRSLRPSNCTALIEEVVDRGAAVHAGKVLAVLKQLGRFAVSRGVVEVNPAGSLEWKDLGVKQSGIKRALSLDEVPLVLSALAATHYPTQTDSRGREIRRPAAGETVRLALRLVLLTACRPGEILSAEWSDVDLDAATWTIPVEKQKLTPQAERNARPFVIPLPPTAVALFKRLQEMAGESPWVLASGDGR